MEAGAEITSAETVVLISKSAPPQSSSGHLTTSRPISQSPEEGRFVPGTLFGGRYRIIGLLGQGGMGEVYRATDLLLGQSVALKLLPETASANPSLLERFYGEVRVARQVSHPNVCRVFDIGEAEGCPFISMEYVDGEDLASLLHRIGRLPSDRAVVASRQLCAGLAAAHAKGVIHRDLKPQNIMMDRHGQIMIMDFGLAALSAQISGPEARHGTPAYMSPEQLRGSDVTAKSDIYALGLVLYELFTGKRPFDADSIQHLIARQDSYQLTSMSSVAADIDPAVEKIIRRCLDPEPTRRPATALSVSAALPGGDPLAAALAAGETPSPEMVAAAGTTEGLALKYSVPCLVLVLLSICILPFFKQQTLAFCRTANSLPPQVLSQKAREAAAALGYVDKPADSVGWLEQRIDLLQYISTLHSPGLWDTWLASEAPARMVYRESLAPLVAQPSGEVSEMNPAPISPGMVEVKLDSAGRLREFNGVPVAGTMQNVPLPEAVFRAAQLDQSRFVSTKPVTTPRGPSDEFHAWTGTHPAIPNIPITVEVASWKGRVTYARVLSPWSPGTETGVQGPKALARSRTVINIIMGVAGFFFAGILARRNWKLGRADRSGAFTLAMVFGVLAFLIWAGAMHPVPESEMFGLLMGGISDSLFLGALAWTLYLALEPALRARWPHTIVTWNRLLAGHWQDSQVAGHVLIGGALAAGILLTMNSVQTWQGELNTMPGLALLNGTRAWASGIFIRLEFSMQIGLIIFFVIFGLRQLVRKDWIAAIVGAIAFSAVQPDLSTSSNLALTFGFYLLIFSVLVFSLVRLGLIVAMSTLFFFNIINSITLGTDWTMWYTSTGVATATVGLATAFLAFYQSMGNRKAESLL